MRLNKTIITLIFADLLLYFGWGFVTPIYALFVVTQIKGGTLEMVGLLFAVFWLTKSFVQPFLANFLDIKKGERDDFQVLVFGMIINSLAPLAYYFATSLVHVFVLEVIRGIAMACVVPSWMGIFSRNINKDWYAFSWSVYSTATGIAIAFSAALGGIIAGIFGFETLFIIVSIFGFCGVLLLFYVKINLMPDEQGNS